MFIMRQTLRASPKSASEGAASIAAVDADNLCVGDSGGFDCIDIARLCNRVAAELGQDCEIRVFANGMSAAVEAIWVKFGARVIRTSVNADPFIEDYLFSADAADQVLIVSGDHAFANAARWHASLGHRVIVWARRTRAAYELVMNAGASRIDFIDDLVTPQPRLRCA
jgi:hypothetical protein